MKTKLLALCVATFGLGSFTVSEASAGESTRPAQVATLPAVAHLNAIEVNIDAGSRHRSRSRRHHSIRRHRHGHRHVTRIRRHR